MENLTLIPDNTPESTQAIEIHYQIKTAMETAAGAMVDMCRSLKLMRDKKLYTHIGFDSFEEYVEKAHNIKKRQAYTYIQTYEKLSPQLMQDNASLGITKLSLLCQISAIEREEFVEENDLNGMTVEEIKKLIEEKNGLHQQISLLQSTAQEEKEILSAHQKELEKLRKELSEKNNIIADLTEEQQSLEPIDTAAVEQEIIDAAVQKALAQAEQDKQTAVKEAVKAEKEKAKKNIEKLAQQQTEEALEKAKAEWEEQNSHSLSQLEQEVQRAKEQSLQLEKQLQVKGDDKLIKFSILFDQLQKNLSDCIDTINAFEDEEKKAKCKNALKAVYDSFLN